MKYKYLIVDTAAIVKNVPLWEYGEELFTVPEVIEECRDVKCKQFLRSLPVEIKIRQPLQSSLHLVNEFTKKTGDYANLSLADIKVIALTYDLEVEALGDDSHLNKSPIVNQTKITTPYTFHHDHTYSINDSFMNEKVNNEVININEEKEITEEKTDIEDVISQIITKNKFFAQNSYINGFVKSDEDNHLALEYENKFCTLNIKDYLTTYPHFFRWFMHIMCLIEESDRKHEDEEFQKIMENMKLEDSEQLVSRSPIVNISENINDNREDIVMKNSSEIVIVSEEGTSDKENDEGWTFVSIKKKPKKYIYSANATDKIEENDGEYNFTEGSHMDLDEGWITPSNIHEVFTKTRGNIDDNSHFPVFAACITADYSVQNILKHIGLNIIGIDGKIIKMVRTYILRCYACGKTTDKMERIFCNKCGHKTLKRVSVTMNEDGSQQIYINTKRSISLKGTNKSIPLPRGGKHPNNPVLVADQRIPQERMTKAGRKKTDAFAEDYLSSTEYFARRDIYSRAGKLGIMDGINQKKRRKR